MKFLKILLVIFITFTASVKADSDNNLINQLQKGEKLIFIRHAYAPGSGDPIDFNLHDCSTQRNLNDKGRVQAKKIGEFFKKKNIKIYKTLSSEWCRCKETANLAFDNFITKNFLNSFYNLRFAKNKNQQMKDLRKYVKKIKSKKNLIFVTHYVVISEALDYPSASGEIVVSDKNFNIIGSIEMSY